MADLKNKPTPIVGTATALRLAVYGDGGVGKSTLALSFPKPIVVDTDGGLEGDAVAGDVIGEQWSPEGWADLNALYEYIKLRTRPSASGERPYDTIVIDSIDTLCRFLLHEAEDMPNRSRGANESLEKLSTADQQDYGKVATAIDRFLTRLKIISKERGIHIVLTSAVRLPDPEKGRLKRTFDVQPAVEAILTYWSNVYGELVNIEVKTGKKDDNGKDIMEDGRILWTKASDRDRKNKTRWAALRPGVSNPTFEKIAGLIEKGQAQ